MFVLTSSVKGHRDLILSNFVKGKYRLLFQFSKRKLIHLVTPEGPNFNICRHIVNEFGALFYLVTSKTGRGRYIQLNGLLFYTDIFCSLAVRKNILTLKIGSLKSLK